MVLNLKSGGKASITYAGSMLDCDYSASGGQPNLNCPDPAGKLGFLIHEDGSLTMTGAGAGMVQTLRRQK